MNILLACGKHQYGRPERGLGTEFHAFLPAFEALGHSVGHFELWDRTAHADFVELNRRLLLAVLESRPDVLVTVPMHFEIWSETLGLIRRHLPTRTICWTTDDSWKFWEFSRFVGRDYDLITTTYPHIVAEYKKAGLDNVWLTQWAAGTLDLRPPMPASECRFPVTFVGAAHGDRRQTMAALRAAGLSVECFGHGWEHGPVAAEDIPEICRRSFLSLNFANARGGAQLKARTFEIPGAGGCLLTEQAPGLERWYVPGEEVLVFSNLPELVNTVRWLRSEPERRDAITRRGHERTVREHTYVQRFGPMLAKVAVIRPGPGSGWPSDPTRLLAIFDRLSRAHRVTFPLSLLRLLLLLVGRMVGGAFRQGRVARRLLFEVSWRLCRGRTYRAQGLPGRFFYRDS